MNFTREVRARRALPRVAALVLVAIVALGSRPLQGQAHAPTIDDLLNLESAGGAQLSPDGRRVAFTVTSTDWKGDAFVAQLWIADVASGARRQLTRDPKGVSAI